MSFIKCCDPLSTDSHDESWTSSLQVEPVSSNFLEEFADFIPTPLEVGSFLCSNCRLKIVQSSKKYNACCNPRDQHSHKTKKNSACHRRHEAKVFKHW